MGMIFLAAMIFFFVTKRNDEIFPLWIKISLISMLAVYLGYTLILVHERYIWICSLLFIPMTAFFILRNIANPRIKQIVEIVLVLVILFSIKKPAKQVLLCGDRNVNAVQFYHTFRSPKETLENSYRKDAELHNDIERLKKIIPKDSRFASIIREEKERDGYSCAQLIAYECEGKYYGQTVSADDSFKGFLISWNEETGELVYGSESGLRVYRKIVPQ
jgi:hypothetical protein